MRYPALFNLPNSYADNTSNGTTTVHKNVGLAAAKKGSLWRENARKLNALFGLGTSGYKPYLF